ncbi:hypothetical protein Ami103574_00085 [Aminipila butyrica]|uniref:Uncharacterized protein n=1 Tax=Aminipila butyrica TaxID=433296 RepID=A0A858BR53_9FIRM|nr:hypothetical protein [Aminipila butyrica]QIB67812.1 hypothetical protein Ami103574_00085 [Aminipila butyrica]
MTNKPSLQKEKGKEKMQKNFTALKEAIEKSRKIKQDYNVELKKILTDQNISEAYRSQKKAELTASTNKVKADILETFSSNLGELRSKLNAAHDVWKNANEPILASTLSLIQMGIQPSKTMIEQFQGDFISMSVLSKALTKNGLYDGTEPYRLTKDTDSLVGNGVDFYADTIGLNFELGVKDVGSYSVSAATEGLIKLSKIVGCDFETETIDYFIAGAKRGSGLSE